MNEITIGQRKIGSQYLPFIIPEIGINHEGNLEKAMKMVDDAYAAGAECVKFQCHIVDDEMINNNVIPANADVSIWEIMSRCALHEAEEVDLKSYVESKGMIYLSTPFSRAAANRLEKIGVFAYKIGSGECNNYPLIEHIASFKKPVLLSTGMNSIESIGRAVRILEANQISYALLHCVSMYPAPYNKIQLGSLGEMAKSFPDAVMGLSDHSLKNYTCFAAIALGASILEKHFTSSKRWSGPDISLSIDPVELKELIEGSKAIHQALGGKKEILPEEQATIDFAYASVVTIRPIKKGEPFTRENLWVKRPGNGEILAGKYEEIIGKTAKVDIPKDSQVSYMMIHE
jgi:N-acetylneuraminate synthase|tara:strand:- start:1697 stop:2731 length:1035 start_codon:yes stop_codon:yes gene_type:complete